MKYSSITIIDIAKALGVSKSTVSRALQNSHDINAETRKKILDYARQNNYEPNPIAKGLQQQQTFSIGVVVPELKNNFFAQVIEGIDEVVYKKGYQIIISQSYEQMEREVETVQHLASRSIDGLIVSVSARSKEYEHFKKLNKKGLPIVFFDRVADDFETHKVVIDNRKVAFTATELLIKKGFRRILHITHAQNLSITQERMKGYKEALEKYQIHFDEHLIYYCDYATMNVASVEKNLMKYLKLKNKPDAIFSSGDRITTIVYGCLGKLGYTIPNDLAFVGFSNNTMIDLLNPNIIVIRQPALEMGKAAAELLIQLIESKKPTRVFEKRVLQPVIVDHSVH
jgi:DNA-binding LacI/PurR family transcriptional regulator